MALASAMGDAFRPMLLKNAAVVRGVCFEMSKYAIWVKYFDHPIPGLLEERE